MRQLTTSTNFRKTQSDPHPRSTRKGGAPNWKENKMLTLFNDIPPYDMHSVVECDKTKDTAIFETALTIQDNQK